jgi:hypothetical protein
MVEARRRSARAGIPAAWTILILVAMTTPTRVVLAQDAIKPLPPDEKAFGRTLGEWQAAWAQWMLSIPENIHPQNDKTGLKFGIGQHLPVWFLPPRWQAQQTSVVVPAGYTLFVPAGPGGLTFYPPGARTDEQLLAERQEYAAQEQLTVLEMSVDGVPIPDLRPYRNTTPVFPLVLPPGNLFGIAVKSSKDQHLAAIADGYYLLLPPLPAGEHVIQGRFEGIDLGDNNKPFKVEWIYHLTVQPPNEPLP